MSDKPKVAFYWCASCGGCEEAVVDLAEKILDVVGAVDIVFWPVALDFKRADVEAKLLALAEHDEFRSPAEVQEVAASWVATEIEVVGGASHFFVGRTDRLVELAVGLVGRLAP